MSDLIRETFSDVDDYVVLLRETIVSIMTELAPVKEIVVRPETVSVIIELVIERRY